ncbi:hypothetical protein AB0J52_35880, partial [Spirillospora sp. NPDC049652]
MGMEIPDEVKWLSWLIGADWPEGDETAMRRAADAWHTASSDVTSLIGELNRAASDVLGALDSGAADKFRLNWEKWTATDPEILPKLAEACDALGQVLEQGATEIEYGKYMFIALLIITAAQIAWLIAAAFATFGASTAAIPAVEAGAWATARTIATQLLERLGQNLLSSIAKGAIMGLLQGGGLDLLIQGIQVAQGHRDGIDLKQVGTSMLDGAIGGAVGGAVGHGVGKIPGLSDAAGSAAGNMFKGAAREGVSGAVGGALGSMATDVAAVRDV